MGAILQVALDVLELRRALEIAREAVRGGADWIEAGTPLIKSEGLESVRALRKEFPGATIIADMKVMDAGRIEIEAAAKAGATIGTVLGAAAESTLRESIEVGRTYGIQVCVDLVGVEDFVGLARKAEELGAHSVCLHVPVDEQMQGKLDQALVLLKALREAVELPIAVAGGIHSESAPDLVKAGADILIVGGAITKASDAEAAARQLKRAIESGAKIKTVLYKRATADTVREMLRAVSTPNISDAMHREWDLRGLIPITAGAKMAGPAYTVRTYPGDWAKPVEAIDKAKPGDVLVIDAGGAPPAVWGELASESCLQKKIAGVVIDGAIRDVDSIRSLGFGAFARIITPAAGEPRGLGETDVPVKICGVDVYPADWIVGDDNGVMRIPKAKAVEIANRAMDVLEHENRIRAEIRRRSSLGEVAELAKWEKQISEKYR